MHEAILTETYLYDDIIREGFHVIVKLLDENLVIQKILREYEDYLTTKGHWANQNKKWNYDFEDIKDEVEYVPTEWSWQKIGLAYIDVGYYGVMANTKEITVLQLHPVSFGSNIKVSHRKAYDKRIKAYDTIQTEFVASGRVPSESIRFCVIKMGELTQNRITLIVDLQQNRMSSVREVAKQIGINSNKILMVIGTGDAQLTKELENIIKIATS